ncbi:hypothetical protein MBLNU230_g1146t1 [Neophaeotheca triangularis]
MEAYPPEYVEHNLPLVLLSGLGHESAKVGKAALRQDSGPRLLLGSEECVAQQAAQLLQALQSIDATEKAWHAATSSGPSGLIGYKMKAIGRSYTLPARKAAPPSQSPSAEGGQSYMSPAKSIELHSPLSPLSPGSPVFPDGIFTPQWFKKHQNDVPCQIVAFFNINAESGETQDNQIKADIESCRAALSRSGFKTRFAAVLISDESILHAPELEDRLASIRRATSLDSKAGLFFMPPMSSQAEIEIFAQSTMAALQPSILEYYRDLTKHTRRKKGRGAPPHNAALSLHGGASKALTTSGWNARYDLKLGAFAEFRQEMETAERHYESTIEELLSSEGIFETVPSWSPRWNEARLLCDAVAIRALRCQLWLSSTSVAARSWSNYRARMKDLVDQRGRGSESYAWEAWEARWAHIMAQLITRSDLPVFRIDDSDDGQKILRRIYAPPEKAFAEIERLPPFHSLHHPGYWQRLSGRKLRARRNRALAIPEEDQRPPEQTPASAVAKRSGAYDTYLVPVPHEEAFLAADGTESGLLRYIAENHGDASVELLSRGQDRLTDSMAMELAQDYIDVDRHEDAFQLLDPVWATTSWRGDTWLRPFSRLLITLRESAMQCKQPQVVLGTSWELLSAPTSKTLVEETLPKTLEPDDEDDGTLKMSYSNRERKGPIAVAFAFATKQGYVGDPLECQVQITSTARAMSARLNLVTIEIHFGQSRKVIISHRPSGNETSGHSPTLAAVDELASDPNGTITGQADLSFAPGQHRIITFPITFREADEVQVKQIDYMVQGDRFTIHHTLTDQLLFESTRWYIPGAGEDRVSERYLPQTETATAMVLPKPPKLRLEMLNLRPQYFVDEPVDLTLRLENGESEVINAAATKSIANEDGSITLHSSWQSGHNTGKDASNEAHISPIAPGDSQNLQLLIHGSIDPASFKVAIDVRYTLQSDPNSELVKSLYVDLPFVKLLDAGFQFGPFYHRDPWPNYFGLPVQGSEAHGIRQQWRLGVALACTVNEEVNIDKAEVMIDRVAGDAVCYAQMQSESSTQALVPKKNLQIPFELETTKTSIDDRRPITLVLTLAVTWSRQYESAKQAVTKLPVPRLNLPTSEPRVLCTISDPDPAILSATVHYHLENPSLHFLTFALTMEASEDFAFSGPKYRTLSLAPFSRHSVQFQLLLHDADAGDADESLGGTWVWPVLQVVDSYYQKTLRVQAAGEGTRNDGKGRLGVLIRTS